MTVKLAHRGICVGNLDDAVRFYEGVFGFASVPDVTCHDVALLKDLLGREDARIRAQQIRDGRGVTFELVQFDDPPPVGPRERRPFNECGLTHLAFWVPDIESVAKRVEEYGGRALWNTRVEYRDNAVEIMYCTDVDGVRIELVKPAKDGLEFMHSGVGVANVEAATHFYRNAIELTPAERHHFASHASWLDPLMELNDVKLVAQVVRGDAGTAIELLHVYSPPPYGSGQRHPPNRYGLAYMTFWADDLDATAKAVSRCGGRIDGPPRSLSGQVEGFSCADPDGATLMFLRDRSGSGCGGGA